METTIEFGRRIGAAQEVGGVQLTPESLVLLLRFGRFGYVWNWPIAVTVAPRQGVAGATRHAIVDVTQIAIWGMRAATLLVVLAALLMPQRWRAKPVIGKRDT
jgi:hypothetical protein